MPHRELRVLSWNVLAAPWASPQWYPKHLDHAVLDRITRRAAIVALLQSIAPPPDVLCLQEVTEPELATIVSALGSDYDGFLARNEPHYWSNWLVPGTEWEINGPAIVVRRDALDGVTFADLTLAHTGNHAAELRGSCAERSVRIASVHLDADDTTRRLLELESLLTQWPVFPATSDILAGDFNEDTAETGIAAPLANAGFADALTELGCHDPTHPYARPADNYASLARLDHIMLREVTVANGRVLDSGVWEIDEPSARLEAQLRRTGSDHLPVVATVDFSAAK